MHTLGSMDTAGFINKNDVTVGMVNALIRLVIPNINPIARPTIGPSKMAPMITGMCMIVALTGPIGMKPSGVIDSMIEKPDSTPMTTSLLTFTFLFVST